MFCLLPLDVQLKLQPCQKKLHITILFYHFYYGSISGPLLLHQRCRGGSFTTGQRCPSWKKKWLRIGGGQGGLCFCGYSEGLGGQQGSQNVGTGGKFGSVEAFLLLFSHTDMSNKRSLLSNIASLNLWCKEELSASSVWSPSITLWTQLYQHKWRLIPLAYCVSRKEVRIATLHFVGFFNSLLKLFMNLNVKNPPIALIPLEVAVCDPTCTFSVKHY